MKTTRASTLRRALDAHTSGRGKRYDATLKSRVVEFAQTEHAEGRSWATIATELGLRFETLRRWCVVDAPASPRAMRRVEIIADASPRTLTVVSPNGYRVDGVTLDEAASLLRALG